MKVTEVVYSAVEEARKKKRFTKYIKLYEQIKEMEPGMSIEINPDPGQFHNVYSRVRGITQKHGGADVFEIDQVVADNQIFVTKKIKGRKKK